MQLSTAYKERLAKAARLVSAGALAISSVGSAVATPVGAAQLAQNSTLVQDSSMSGVTTYTVNFVPPTGSLSTVILRVDGKFCTQAGAFDDTCTAPAGLNIDNGMGTGNTSIQNFAVTGGPNTLASSVKDSTNTWHVTLSGAGSVETSAVHSITLNGIMTNPNAQGTYFTLIRTFADTGATTAIDEGESAFAILSPVTVSGRVVETLAFTVNGVSSTVACGTYASATITTSPTAVPFGNFLSGTPRIGCQTVATGTNANGGFTTTIHEVSADGTAPEGGMCRQTALNCNATGGQSGVSASDVIGDTGLTDTPATYGVGVFGLGYGVSGNNKDVIFTTPDTYRSLFSATAASPAPVSSASGPITAVSSTVHVIFKADVSQTQTAGLYQNQIEYVSTPKF